MSYENIMEKDRRNVGDILAAIDRELNTCVVGKHSKEIALLEQAFVYAPKKEINGEKGFIKLCQQFSLPRENSNMLYFTKPSSFLECFNETFPKKDFPDDTADKYLDIVLCKKKHEPSWRKPKAMEKKFCQLETVVEGD